MLTLPWHIGFQRTPFFKTCEFKNTTEETFEIPIRQICDQNISIPNEFERDLKAELLGKKPVRRLKPSVVPTVNLPNCLSAETSTALGRKSQMEVKIYKEGNIR